MKELILTVSCFLSFSSIRGQSPDFEWVKRTSGTNNETPVAINVDAAGNIYTSGYFEGTVDFDPGTNTYTLVSPGVVSMYISKHNAQGTLVWVRQISTPVQMANAVAHPNSQALCTNGDVCVTGFYTGAYDFDPGPGNFFMSASNENAFVLKLNAQGNFLWSKQWGGAKTDICNGITLDASDAIYTTGFFMDTVDFDPGPASFTVAADADNVPEAFVSKLDASGNFVWVRKFGSLSGSIGNAITLDNTGNIHTTGTFIGTTDFDPGAGVFSMTSVNDQDIFAHKMNAAGNLIWVKAMGGANKEGGTSIVTNASGDVCVSGFFTGTCDFDSGVGTQTVTSLGNEDLFILKLDGQGNLLWVHGMGSPGTDVVSGMAVDASGAVYSTGQFSGAMDFDPGVAVYSLNASVRNTFISKYDGQGNYRWAKHLAGADYNAGSAIVLSGPDEVLVTGIFSLTTDFDPNTGNHSLTATGEFDGYLLKLNCRNPPDIAATSTSSTLCSGAIGTLVPSGANTYSWNGIGGTNLPVSPLATTNYTLRGESQNGCVSEVIITQYVTDCTGFEIEPMMANAQIFPNPNNGEFMYTGPPATKITVFNGLGELICKKVMLTGEEIISIKDFPTGIYLLEVEHDNGKRVLKMIKE